MAPITVRANVNPANNTERARERGGLLAVAYGPGAGAERRFEPTTVGSNVVGTLDTPRVA